MEAALAEALNQLLEDERACVEALVGLTSMATDALERYALTAMGGQAVQACGDLHEQLARADIPISAMVGTAAEQILAHDRVDERLRAFSQLQADLAGVIARLLVYDMDHATRSLLTALQDVHRAHADWSGRRATEFAASREAGEEFDSATFDAPGRRMPLTERRSPFEAKPPDDMRQDRATASEAEYGMEDRRPFVREYSDSATSPAHEQRPRPREWAEEPPGQPDDGRS